MHLNLATRDLDASVAFYSTLLGASPAKRLDDYALFITEQPGLRTCARSRQRPRTPRRPAFRHRCRTPDAVDAQILRLTAAGYATDIEREETCWLCEPDEGVGERSEGRRWETYFVHEDTEETRHRTTCRAVARIAAESSATCAA